MKATLASSKMEMGKEKGKGREGGDIGLRSHAWGLMVGARGDGQGN